MDYLNTFKKFLKENSDAVSKDSKFDDLEDKDIDNDGDVDGGDSYLHNKLSNVATNVDEDEELEEMSVTGAVAGYQTPNAFGDGSTKSKKKKKKNATNSTGYEMVNDSIYKKMMKQLDETSYRDYKKDPTSTPSQKVNRGIMEVNKMLAEIEKIVVNNLRLKTETGVQSGHFWKTTGKRFAKINERMLRVAHRLKELSQ